ncbi:hypothetical protein TrLO_g7502 [Triparma laevis f. longispina]|uniref:Uncharacterized protein n=1 Tax=Triparma laevis f. longispina TaxID=1714387 RepID=A0A9W7AFJ9_9STRA|nr:hypothetical protein TrLO_g7502 [Triparma laevis f. longispina]
MPLSKTECTVLQDRLGNDPAYPKRCNTLIIQNDHAADTDGGHKNSWLWPKLARRATKNANNDNGLHTQHPSNWHGDVNISADQCAAIKAAFKKMGVSMKELPADCK